MMRKILIPLLVLALSHCTSSALAQCEVYDGNGNASANPVWVSCSGGAFTLFIQSPNNFGAITIDWGDGSPNTNVPALVPPAFVQHTYAAAIANYTVTITETATACVITGLVVMEEPVNASIQIPIGGVTQICAPDDMLFTNSSTDVSQNTVFTWDFGDGSPILTFGDTNAGQTITHTYQQNTVNCVTAVTLTAENYCSFGNPTEATFNPVQIFDIDDAQIDASNTLLCYPDTVVHFDNATNKNCVPQGNTVQRFEYWNFGNYWGTGNDSIIDWLPFDPPARVGYDIAFPGLGTYQIMMIDSNQCGQDTAYIQIDIVDPPTAGIAANLDTVCTGDPVAFTNLSFGGGNQFLINFNDGSGFVNFNTNQNHTFTAAGMYTVQLVANIVGGTANCTDTAEVDVVVLPTPNADFTVNPIAACDSLEVTFTNNSTGGSIYFWDFDNGDTSTLANPPTANYTTPGAYTISLSVTSNNGCVGTDNESVTVNSSPVAAFTAQNVCEDELATFSDASTIGFGGPITSWDWSFGDPSNSTSTAQNPTFTYVDSGTYVVELIVASATCADTIADTVSVEPRPISAFAESDSIGCSPFEVSFTNLSTGYANQTWYFGDGNTSTAISPSYTFVHTGQTDTTFIVKLVTETTFGCKDSVSDTITVLGNPTASFSSDAALDCAPLEVNFSDASSGGVSLIWDFGDSTGSTLANPSHIFENQTQFITNYTVLQIVTAANGCVDTASEIVTVYPEPLFNFSIVPDSGCSPLNVQFPVAVGAVLYQWDFGDGNTASGPAPTHQFVNTTTNNAVYNVQLIATSPFGCIDTTTGQVTVFPNPTSVFTPPSDSGCQPLAVPFINSSSGGTSFFWDFDDGNTSTTNNTSVPHTYTNNTNDTAFFYPSLVVTTDKGCSDTSTAQITVFRPVVSSFSAPDSGCHPLNANLVDSSLNPVSWLWDFDDGNTSNLQSPSHQFVNSGTTTQTFDVTLQVTNAEGCADISTLPVVVHPKPNAALAPLTSAGCEPLEVNFTNTSALAVSYDWDFDDGNASTSAATTLAYTYPNPTNDSAFFNPSLIVTSVDGCTDTAMAQVIVYPQVQADFSGPDTGCHPLGALFSDLSTNPFSWQWDFGDGSISTQQSPSHLFQNVSGVSQSFDVSLLVTTLEGCQDADTQTVVVHPKPLASFIPSSNLGCEPLIVSFTNSSNLAVSYAWDFGNGNTSTSGAATLVDTFFNASNVQADYTAELIVTSQFGCTDTQTTTISVHPQIIAGFDVDTAGCHPLIVNFNDLSTNAASYQWNFGDGSANSPVSNPLHQYNNLSTVAVSFTATQTVTNLEGCQDDRSVTIDVFPKPDAVFNINSTPSCSGDEVMFVNNSILNDINYWTFGASGFPSIFNGTTIDTILYNFSSTPITYPVNLTVENIYGCRDSVTQNVTINPEVNAEFIALNEGCSPLEVDFINNSSGAQLYQWDFDDGTLDFDPSPSHVFVNNTNSDITFSVVLTATSQYNCVDRDTFEILVHPTPEAIFTASPLVQTFPDATVLLDNLTSAGPWSFEWDFGDGDISTFEEPISHQYPTWGEYTIVLTAFSQFCQDTSHLKVKIIPPLPIANFELSDSGCAPVTITIENLSEYGTEYLWDFGDGGKSSATDPTYTYNQPGNYTIQLTATGPGGDVDTKVIVNAVNVYQNPTANFGFSPTQVAIPNEPVTFINYSIFASQYLWDFGDSNTSTEENPQHLYRTAGQFFPQLFVRTDFGCSDTFIAEIPVTALEVGSIEVPNAFTPSTTGGSGGLIDPFAIDNYVFFPVKSGVVKEGYLLSIYNRWGELIFQTDDPDRGWDGYYKGEICQQDAYVWKLQGQFVNGTKFTKVGDVTLIR